MSGPSIAGEKKVLIVGYGNPARGDDGLGWLAAEQIAAELTALEVEVLRVQQLAPELAECMRSSRAVIFIDAARDLAAGELRCTPVPQSSAGILPAVARPSWPRGGDRTPPRQSPGQRRSPDSEFGRFSHHLTPAAVLTLCRELYGAAPPVFSLTLGAESFDAGAPLSEKVERALPGLIRLVKRLAQELLSAAPEALADLTARETDSCAAHSPQSKEARSCV